MTLDQLKLGRSAMITHVGGEGALRRRLLDMGLTPNTQIFVRKVAPLGDPIELCLRGYELTLRKQDAAQIDVAEYTSGCSGCCGCGACHRKGRNA